MSWMKVPAAAEYMGVSPRTIRSLLKTGLPYSKLDTGTILIEKEQLDKWLRGFSVSEKEKEKVDQIINDLFN